MTTTPKAQEVFSTELLTLIENERLDNSTAIVKVGDYTWVRILSTSAINDPAFTPLSDEIIVIDPDDVMIRTTISNESNNQKDEIKIEQNIRITNSGIISYAERDGSATK